MKRWLFCVLMLMGSPLWACPDANITADRANALEAAGSFAKEGYLCRESYLPLSISPEKPALIQVNLFAGNAYWFIAAANASAQGVRIEVFDAKGKPVAVESYELPLPATAGFTPAQSGPYILRITVQAEGPVCGVLLYCYK